MVISFELCWKYVLKCEIDVTISTVVLPRPESEETINWHSNGSRLQDVVCGKVQRSLGPEIFRQTVTFVLVPIVNVNCMVDSWNGVVLVCIVVCTICITAIWQWIFVCCGESWPFWCLGYGFCGLFVQNHCIREGICSVLSSVLRYVCLSVTILSSVTFDLTRTTELLHLNTAIELYWSDAPS